jgi:hypothetical protein
MDLRRASANQKDSVPKFVHQCGDTGILHLTRLSTFYNLHESIQTVLWVTQMQPLSNLSHTTDELANAFNYSLKICRPHLHIMITCTSAFACTTKFVFPKRGLGSVFSRPQCFCFPSDTILLDKLFRLFLSTDAGSYHT